MVTWHDEVHKTTLHRVRTISHVRGILSYLCADLVDLLRVLPQFGRQLVVVTDLELQQPNNDVNIVWYRQRTRAAARLGVKNVGKIFAVRRRDHNDDRVDVRLERLLDQDEDSLWATPTNRPLKGEGHAGTAPSAGGDTPASGCHPSRAPERARGAETWRRGRVAATRPNRIRSGRPREGRWLRGHKRAPARMTRQG